MNVLKSKASLAIGRRTDSASNQELEEMMTSLEIVAKPSLKTPAFPPSEKRLSLRVYDRTECGKTTQMFANSADPFEVDNDMVRGQAILKVKTDPQDHYAPYFAGRQRMFEIMIRGQLKDIGPNDLVYMGIETAGPIKLSGFFTKAAAKIVLGLISSTVPHAHCTLGNEKETGQLTFPLDLAVDRLAVTKPGDLPPTMGVHMFPEEYAREKRAPLKCYNTEDIYSFSLHSMYVDLAEWKLVNLPGLGTVPLDTFIKGQPLYFVGYVLSRSHRGPHTPQNKRYLFKFELDNDHRRKQ